MPSTAQMPNAANIVPISSQGAVQPPDSNTQLMIMLQQLIDKNPPKSDMSQATPDQQAAGDAASKTEEKGKKPVMPAGATVTPKTDAGGTPSLPDIISQLFGDKNANDQKGTDGASKSPLLSYEGGLTRAVKTFKGEGGDSKAGTVSSALKFIAMFG